MSSVGNDRLAGWQAGSVSRVYLYNCAAHKIVSGAGAGLGVSKSDDIIMGISQTCFIN